MPHAKTMHRLSLARSTPYLLGGMIVLGGFLRFYAIGDKDLWLDEAFSVWMSRHPLPALIDWLVRIDQHPPLYYMLLHFWLAFGDTAAHVRILSALLSTLTIPVIFLIGQRISGQAAGLIAAFILALTPFHVRFAQETRMYALLTLNVALSLLALVYLLSDPRAANMRLGCQFSRFVGSRQTFGAIATDLAWGGYVVFTAAAVLTHSTAIFFPVAVNLFVLGLLAWRRWGRHTPGTATFNPPSLSNWLLAQIGVFLCWSPWLVAFVVQSIGVYHAFWIPAPSLDTVIASMKALLNDFWPVQSAWGQLIWVGYAVLLILGIVHLRKRLAVAALLIVLVLTPFIGELLVSLRRPIFYDRTLIWTTLPLYLLLALGFVEMRRKPAIMAGLIMLATINGLSLQSYYVHYEKEQWRDAAAYVAAHAQNNDLILFNATWVQLPFDFYFRAFKRPIAEHGLPVDLFARGVLEPKMTHEDLPRLRSLLHNRSRVWLIYSHDWYTDPQQLIPTALAQAFDLADSQQLRGLQVQLYTVPVPGN